MNPEDDLLGGESSFAEEVGFALDKERWRFLWAQRLTLVVIGVIAIFYLLLVVFILCRHFTLTVGTGYWFFSTSPFRLTDTPVLFVLTTIPTLLLIAVLKYFHYNEKAKPDAEPSSISLNGQMMTEVIKAVGSVAKPSQ